MTAWSRDRTWAAIRAERARLADDLARLSDAQWETRALCTGWSIEQTVAHLTAAASVGRLRWMASMAGARFDPAVHNARRLAEHLGPTPADTLAAFRKVIDSRVEPARTTWAWLGEVVVHATDIREPLGITRHPDPAAVTHVARWYAAKDWAVNSRTAAQGLRLVADDGPFREGAGPEVHGRTLDLVMAMAGRPSALDRLRGDGVGILRGRLGKAS